MDTCTRCGSEPKVLGKRYCKACVKTLRKEMFKAGYLQLLPAKRRRRYPAKDSQRMDIDSILKRI